MIEDGPSGSDSEAPTAASPVDVTGQTIAVYRVLQKLGEGGMGVVYEAEQEEPVRRKVALKLIKPGMDTGEVLARFESERQALALMNHPSIASIFDGGATEDGRPYFAMELVHGEPLTAYCDKHRLTVRERLGLFLQVCEGVQHAHQKGIIHRDLKPSNILVTIRDDSPVPKIIDFGVAKATSQRLTERTVHTQLGQRIGTPVYMSPEQAEMTGLDIDTRTDVYSLGVVLYELLAGAQPFDPTELRKAGFEGLQRILRESEPPKPSTKVHSLGKTSTDPAHKRGVELSALERELRGDLDWITMKALEKDRTRRYGSVSDLASDIQRHLRHEAVLASPPSTVYRTRKFVRRHRFGVAAVVTLVALLAVFAGAMAVQAQRIARERDRANREAKTATQVQDFLVDLFLVSRPSEAAANTITAREVLDRGADRIDRELGGQPGIRAALLGAMGRAYLALGLYDKAYSLQNKALDTKRELFGPRSAETARSMADLAEALHHRGRFGEAESMARESLELRRNLPRDGNAGSSVADSLVLLGWILSDGKADYEEAETLLREALEVLGRRDEDNGRTRVRALTGLASVLVQEAKYSEAEQLLREALGAAREVYGEDNPYTVVAGGNLASALYWQGRHEEAELVWRELLARKVEMFGPEHPDLAQDYSNLGGVLYFQGKYEEAVAMYQRALAIYRKAFPGDHVSIAVQLMDIGQALDAQGRPAEAEPLCREALAMYRRVLGGDHPSVSIAATFLATSLRHLGSFSEAENLSREAVSIATRRLGEEHPRTQGAAGELGLALAKQGRWVEAEPLLLAFAHALEAKTGVEGDAREVREAIAEMYEAWGKPDKAAEYRDPVNSTPPER
jgi:serine/threonine protein kinase/tetratricopeptide (TPR) repeat protein